MCPHALHQCHDWLDVYIVSVFQSTDWISYICSGAPGDAPFRFFLLPLILLHPLTFPSVSSPSWSSYPHLTFLFLTSFWSFSLFLIPVFLPSSPPPPLPLAPDPPPGSFFSSFQRLISSSSSSLLAQLFLNFYSLALFSLLLVYFSFSVLLVDLCNLSSDPPLLSIHDISCSSSSIIRQVSGMETGLSWTEHSSLWRVDLYVHTDCSTIVCAPRWLTNIHTEVHCNGSKPISIIILIFFI